MAKKSTPITHFEVYVLVRGHWMLQVRYPHHQREQAVAEAKALEQSLGAAVKVIRETYFPDTNTCEEVATYLSPKVAKTKARPERPRQRTASVAPPRPVARRPRRAEAAEDGAPAGAIVLKLLIIIVTAMIAASVAVAALTYVMASLGGFDDLAAPDAYPKLVFGTFAVTFLLVAIPATLRALEQAHRGQGRKSPATMIPGTPAAPGASEFEPSTPVDTFHRAATKALSEVLSSTADYVLGNNGETNRAVRTASEGAQPSQPQKNEHPDTEPMQTEPPMEMARLLGAGASSPEAPDLDRHRILGMRFLGEVISTVKRASPQLDAYNRFGINLLLAGAVDALGAGTELGAEGRRRLLRELVGMLGSKTQAAQTFCDKLDEYVLEPRYMQMIGLGREAMERFAASDPTALSALPGAMERWNRPADKQAPHRITTVMFTDMVGSIDITQSQGDLAAQELVRRHNGIVRNALSEFDGREVKHTGDGIMASFASTANALDAAIAIQRATASYNDGSPSAQMQLRIGINAGEPIEEEDDLFGTTVQLAARLCAAAGPGRILCSNVVRELSAGTDRHFVHQGEQQLKGFREPTIVHEVLWQPSADGATEAATNGIPEEQPDPLLQAP